jgi:hypothetical protein
MANVEGWAADEAGVYFSDRFVVDPQLLADYGALDISVVTDLPLFIDPFLLFNSDRGDYQALHQSIIDYLRFLKSKAGALSPGLIDAWYRFGEVRQNWLGFVESGNSGHGLGRGFAVELHEALTSLLSDFGSETLTESTHLEKVALIREGVGRDTISDFTTNLIKHFLCQYTQTFALEHLDPALTRTFPVPRVAFNYNTESWVSRSYTLPDLDGDFVLLTPVDMLTRDDTWINRSDMVHSYDQVLDALSDAQLRAQVDNYLASRLVANPTAKELRQAQATVFRAFPEMVDLYIKLKEDDRDEATSVSAAKTADTRAVLIDQVRAAADDIAAKTDLFATPWTSFDEAKHAVATFKHYVEHQDGYRLINRGGGRPFASEKDVHAFFGLLLTWSRFDVNREPNNGRGPVDFKLSAGALDKTLIEFKLAKSSSLKRNLERQVEIYEKANKTSTSMKVIISYTDDDMAKAAKVVSDLGLADTPAVVIVDARDNKPSASVA